MVAMDFFEASNFYDFFNQYCLNLLKNPTVRGLTNTVKNGVFQNSCLGCLNVHSSTTPNRVFL